MDVTQLAPLLTREGWALLSALPDYDEAQALPLAEKLRSEGHPPMPQNCSPHLTLCRRDGGFCMAATLPGAECSSDTFAVSTQGGHHGRHSREVRHVLR